MRYTAGCWKTSEPGAILGIPDAKQENDQGQCPESGHWPFLLLAHNNRISHDVSHTFLLFVLKGKLLPLQNYGHIPEKRMIVFTFLQKYKEAFAFCAGSHLRRGEGTYIIVPTDNGA